MTPECNHSWHPECQQFIQNDCGLTSQMLAGALSVSDTPTTPVATKAPSIKKEKKQDVQIVNGHLFRNHTYHTPIWCNHCHNFIWGFSKQGWRCESQFSFPFLFFFNPHRNCDILSFFIQNVNWIVTRNVLA